MASIVSVIAKLQNALQQDLVLARVSGNQNPPADYDMRIGPYSVVVSPESLGTVVIYGPGDPPPIWETTATYVALREKAEENIARQPPSEEDEEEMGTLDDLYDLIPE